MLYKEWGERHIHYGSACYDRNSRSSEKLEQIRISVEIEYEDSWSRVHDAFLSYICEIRDHQQPGIDYVESLSPVAHFFNFRVWVALEKKLKLVFYYEYVQTVYLNADLAIK